MPKPHGNMKKKEKARDFKGTVSKLLSYTRPYYFKVIFVLVLTVVSTLLSIIAPKVTGNATTLLFEGIVSKYTGGAGIDFGMEPKLSREGVDRGTPYKLVVYEFNKAVEDVDQAVQNVLLEQGYTRTVVPDEKRALRAIYRKEKKRILFRYAHTFKEGFNEKTTLTMSWAKE